MQALAATTELDSVNIMLSTIGESPINSLSADQQQVDVAIARQVLREVATQIQEEGWNFNTEIGWVLTPDSTGTIYLPANCIQLEPADKSLRVSVRAGKLYDRLQHSFNFNGPVKVSMVILLPFDDMPEASRHYITIRAARVFQQRVVGSEALGSFTEKDEMRARASLKKLDGDDSNYNILTGSWSVLRVLTR